MAKMIAKTTKRPRTKLRAIRITRKFTEAPGSVLFEMGQTRILCTASFEPSVPPWRTGSGKGWVTAEYNMLPSSTIPRKPRPRSGHTDSRGGDDYNMRLSEQRVTLLLQLRRQFVVHQLLALALLVRPVQLAQPPHLVVALRHQRLHPLLANIWPQFLN